MSLFSKLAWRSPLVVALALSSTRADSALAADDSDSVLAAEARRADLVRLALARNPDLEELVARVAAARGRRDLAGRLPEAELRYEQRGLPLAEPLAYKRAESLMIGLRQTLPVPGTLDARSRVAGAEAQRQVEGERQRRLELTAQVRRAFAEYYRSERQLRLHREHAELTARLVELTRSSYRAGRRGQQDVIRLSLELSRVHADLAHMEPELRAARALVNLLVNRPPQAPLGPPEELAPATVADAASDKTDAATVEHRPEIAAARAAIAREQASADLARLGAWWPSLMLGLDYMYMPERHDMRHGYSAMVGLSLPWLSGGRRDERRIAGHNVRAEEKALEATRNALRYELEEARARYEAASAQYVVIERDIVGQARRNFEAAESAYAAGNADALTLLDAVRLYLDVRLDRVRALAHLETAAAELARAAGKGERP